MVRPFQFARVPQIFFKNGVITQLPVISALCGGKIVLVTGKSSFLKSQQSEKLFHDFDKGGIEYNTITISGEPSPEIVDEAVKSLSDREVNLVIAIGGGSVLDSGKAISAMIGKKESVTEFLEGVGIKEHPGNKIAFIAVPTTSGTGSEVTKNAVISRVGKNGFKRSLRHDNLVPDIALVDPELTLSCPKEITAAGGMDCFTQLTEAYLSNKSIEYTDALATEGFKEIRHSLLRCYCSGDNIEARNGMSFAALTSGICLANAGLGVVHGFAASIGGIYNIPHGVICGTLMAVANEVNVRELRKKSRGHSVILKKYTTLGKIFLDENGKTDDYYIDGFINYLHKLTGELNLKGLGHYGLEEKNIGLICSTTEMKNNPVQLPDDKLFEILERRL